MTPSSLQEDKKHNCIIVTRLIRYKLHRIEFSSEVKAQDIIPYFNMMDEDFMKFALR